MDGIIDMIMIHGMDRDGIMGWDRIIGWDHKDEDSDNE
jgi:hypothetical protein